MSDPKKKILVVSVEGVGHVNSCVGLTTPLLHRGHRVAFLTEQTFAGKLKARGFEEIVYETFHDVQEIRNDQLKPGDLPAEQLINNGILGERDHLKSMKNIVEFFFKSDRSIRYCKHWNEAVKKAIQEFRPDLFIVDSTMILPEIHYSGRPVIVNISAVPTFSLVALEDQNDRIPPAGSGLSIDSDKSLWQPFKQVMRELFYNKKYNDMLEESGYKRYPDDCVCPQIQKLTTYAVPEEYNYPALRDLKDWFNIEVYNKNSNQETVVDLKQLVAKEFYHDDLDGRFTGKWIYVSMGSMGSAYLPLMRRLVEALRKTNHKYIVSKGPRHQEFELERNMWGDRFLPQTKILSLVDLVLTHGGNNSVTETFAQGKPMIVLPLFADQPDNAQRLHETGYGIRLDPYSFTEQELHESIERLLSDQDLKQRLAKASRRIQTTNTHEQFADRVDQILANADSQPNS